MRLNLAIFALSMAAAAILALYTAAFRSDSAHTAIIVVAIVGTLLGVYLLIAWRRERESLSQTCDVTRSGITEPETIINETSFSTLVTPVEALPPTNPSESKH